MNCLVTLCSVTFESISASFEFIGSQRSADLKKVLEFILVPPPMIMMARPNVFDVTARLHHRLLAELQNSYRFVEIKSSENPPLKMIVFSVSPALKFNQLQL
jgi:hypothetical protein